MEICLIAPMSMLQYTIDEPYHLCLSGEVLKNPGNLYTKFYQEQALRQDRYVILDNSAHETGCGDGVEALCHAIDIVQPQEVVLPDRLFFGEDTIELSTAAFEVLNDRYPLQYKYMGVPQGRTTLEWLDCLSALINLGVDTIGVSKDYEVWPGGLPALIRHVFIRGKNKPNLQVHLLGWGRDLQQLSIAARSFGPALRSVDSAKPFVYAHYGVAVPRDLTKAPHYPRRPDNYFGLTAINHEIMDHNIEVFRICAKGGILPYEVS